MPRLYDMELLRAGDAAEKASEVGSGVWALGQSFLTVTTQL